MICVLSKSLKKSIGVSVSKKRTLLKIAGITVTFSTSFLLRFAMLLYRPITDKYFKYGIYITFTYFVPEMIPTCVQLFVMRLKFVSRAPSISQVPSGTTTVTLLKTKEPEKSENSDNTKILLQKKITKKFLYYLISFLILFQIVELAKIMNSIKTSIILISESTLKVENQGKNIFYSLENFRKAKITNANIELAFQESNYINYQSSLIEKFSKIGKIIWFVLNFLSICFLLLFELLFLMKFCFHSKKFSKYFPKIFLIGSSLFFLNFGINFALSIINNDFCYEIEKRRDNYGLNWIVYSSGRKYFSNFVEGCEDVLYYYKNQNQNQNQFIEYFQNLLIESQNLENGNFVQEIFQNLIPSFCKSMLIGMESFIFSSFFSGIILFYGSLILLKLKREEEEQQFKKKKKKKKLNLKI
ncbi:hypothetical protein M0811_11217 [Anaeramoeba ignava]|uniref:Uncharacterized protein n=1 Tax=Anaeramoeba ignava TaxID=1746090 RepID=A0A9Q0LCH6_ANAIG|nr:hypothetical protein M0811_11217 [Anaeramoeba ignava]